MVIASHTPDTESDFHDLLQVLRENDDRATGIDVCSLPTQSGTASALGLALRGNTMVSFLALNLRTLLSRQDLATDNFDPILQFIRTSSALRSLRLRATVMDDNALMLRLVAQIASAVAENSGIDTFKCEVGKATLFLLANVLRTAPHITTLTASFEPQEYSLADQVMIVDAFATNQSLKDVTFRVSASACILVDSALICLGSFPKLRLLALFYCFADLDGDIPTTHFYALEQFLRSSKTVECMSLGGCKFITKASADVFAALSVSPCKLFHFSGCKLDQEATESFVQFVQAIDKADSCLSISSDVEFEQSTIGHVMAKVLSRSSLMYLNLSNGPELDLTELFDSLSAVSSKMSLACLSLDRISASEEDALSRFIRSTRKLQYLCIDSLDDGVDHRKLVNAIRQNGSLWRVRCHALGPLYGSFLENIARRNAVIPHLLQSPDFSYWAPIAFHTVQVARQTAPNALLIGLLTAGRCVGSRRSLPSPPRRTYKEVLLQNMRQKPPSNSR